MNMANIFEFLSKYGIITPEKARKSRQMQFHDKTAYVWVLCYWWDSSLSMNPVRQFAHFMPPCNYGRLSIITMNCHLDHQDIRMFLLLFPIIIKLSNILKYFHCLFSLCIWSCSMGDCYFNYFQLSKLAPSNLSHLNLSYWFKIEQTWFFSSKLTVKQKIYNISNGFWRRKNTFKEQLMHSGILYCLVSIMISAI